MALVLRKRLKRLTEPIVNYHELDTLLNDGDYRKILITRKPPSDGHSNDIVFVWVSKAPHPKAVEPTSLHIIEALTWKELQNGAKSVILDALEYLMVENGLEKTLKFVGKLRDIAILNGAKFYVTISEGIDEKTRTMLQRIIE
jgi:hypothetical protein